MELNHISTHTEEGWFSHTYFNISEEQYNRIAHKIIWPTEIYPETGYLGAIIFRVKYDEKNWDILCWLNEKTYKDKKYINLYPCNYIKHDYHLVTRLHLFITGYLWRIKHNSKDKQANKYRYQRQSVN